MKQQGGAASDFCRKDIIWDEVRTQNFCDVSIRLGNLYGDGSKTLYPWWTPK